MSRSNPTNGLPNPSTRWHEYNGETGTVRYYDKEAKKNVDIGSDFAFVLLDELGTVRGWHEPSQSGIYANEVRDSRQDVLIVKSFKGGILAEGLYQTIKDRVNTLGGQYVANLYIGYKNDADELALGSIRFKGAALGAWMEFRKANRNQIYTKGIAINGYTEGKKGRIIFRVPVFGLVEVSEGTNIAANELDQQLQAYLSSYLKKNKADQVDTPPAHVSDEDVDYDENVPEAEDIPF